VKSQIKTKKMQQRKGGKKTNPTNRRREKQLQKGKKGSKSATKIFIHEKREGGPLPISTADERKKRKGWVN